jgi:hypothetical protein
MHLCRIPRLPLPQRWCTFNVSPRHQPGLHKGIDTMSHSPAPASLPLPAPRQKRPEATPRQLRLPGQSHELVIAAIVFFWDTDKPVRVKPRAGLFGTTTGQQAFAAIQMGARVEYAQVHTTPDGVEVVEVQGEARS